MQGNIVIAFRQQLYNLIYLTYSYLILYPFGMTSNSLNPWTLLSILLSLFCYNNFPLWSGRARSITNSIERGTPTDFSDSQIHSQIIIPVPYACYYHAFIYNIYVHVHLSVCRLVVRLLCVAYMFIIFPTYTCFHTA